MQPHRVATPAGFIQFKHARQQSQPHPSFFPIGCGSHPAQGSRVTPRDGIMELSSSFVVGHGVALLEP